MSNFQTIYSSEVGVEVVMDDLVRVTLLAYECSCQDAEHIGVGGTCWRGGTCEM